MTPELGNGTSWRLLVKVKQSACPLTAAAVFLGRSRRSSAQSEAGRESLRR